MRNAPTKGVERWFQDGHFSERIESRDSRILVVVTEAPYNADNIGVLDIATERFETIDISHTTTADMKCLGTKKD